MTKTRKTLVTLLCLVAVSTGAARGGDSDVIYPQGVSAERLGTEAIWPAVSRLKVGDRPRVILVLGGGGARGLSAIGVLRVFEQERIPVDQVIGVSVGALIGALFASGVSVDRIEEMASEVGWNQLSDFSKVGMVRLILNDDLLTTDKMQSFMDDQVKGRNFSDLNVPFACIATDLRTGERVIFREGPVALAARASATIPGIFRPVEYRHRLLVDGGLVDNFPTDVAITEGNDLIVGVLPRSTLKVAEVSTVFQSLVRSIEVQRDVIMKEKKKTADFLIEPDVGSVSFIDLGRSKECIEAGVVATRKAALDLKKLIIIRTVQRRNHATAQR